MNYKKERITYYDCETMKKITAEEAAEIITSKPGDLEEFFSNESKTIYIYWLASGGRALEIHITNLEKIND